MKNIFENAYFGKPYKTRDCRKAIYLTKYKHGELVNELAIEDSEAGRRFYLYADNGSFYHKPSCEDIVSEWQEEINEEELNSLAEEYVHNSRPLLDGDAISCFKAGYRKAKEE